MIRGNISLTNLCGEYTTELLKKLIVEMTKILVSNCVNCVKLLSKLQHIAKVKINK